uniref:ribonuclease Z n=1 Tax=Chromera velia CCMP2878 TaxID=1169474 RepID=A0A0G4IB09_9ALVE|eukprot:Cvel_12611.t1-p1 / transcript=Cvel_12611.t1 / gene=Cvel_12611 / organism=Chromera_velia_CCMP2878 / gene_product=Ribonuclease Z, mitochondrial, putative / transcript_product=Ribonuclease Z, mitochondrial, putative / location=Cvel_scaffold832:37184-44845(+) / protein_length=1030 / sequence_SO=supercontig / SO=protein_coding / is_pseudo=false
MAPGRNPIKLEGGGAQHERDFSVQTLGNHRYVLPPSLSLQAPSERILVNSGENTQRFTAEQRQLSLTMNTICLTSFRLDRMGGLMGLLLTLNMASNEIENPRIIRIYGRRRVEVQAVELGPSSSSSSSSAASDTTTCAPETARMASSLDLFEEVSPYTAEPAGCTAQSSSRQAQSDPTCVWPVRLSTESAWTVRARGVGASLHGGGESSSRGSFESDVGKGSASLVEAGGAAGIREGVSEGAPCVNESLVGGQTGKRKVNGDEEREGAAGMSRQGDGGAGDEANGSSDSSSHRWKKLRSEYEQPQGRPHSSAAMILHVQVPPFRGKFDANAALRLGVPSGPLRGKLTRGESVTLPGGRTIHPHEVMSPDTRGGDALILDAPDVHALKSLLGTFREEHTAEIEKHEERWRGGVRTDSLAFIFYLMPPEVCASPLLDEVVDVLTAPAKDGEKAVEHVFCDRTGEGLPAALLQGASCLQALLHEALPRLFPAILRGAAGPAADSGVANELLRRRGREDRRSDTIDAKSLTTFVLSPSKSVGVDAARELSQLRPRFDPKRLQPVGEAVEQCKRLSAALESNRGCGGGGKLEGLEVLFLGTGSMLPVKYRNVSCILLRWKDADGTPSCMMFDCGEGSVSQLFAACTGFEEFKRHLEGLKAIFISHRHEDHFFGLPFLLSARRELLPSSEPPVVIAPRDLLPWLEFVDATVEGSPMKFVAAELLEVCFFKKGKGGDAGGGRGSLLNLEAEVVEGADLGVHLDLTEAEAALDAVEEPTSASILNRGDCVREKDLLRELHERLGVTLHCCRVPHLRDSFAVRVSMERPGHSEPVSLVYSGDTRPTPNVIALSRNVDVLIHEATFMTIEVDAAISKRHSTLKEALYIGRLSGCKLLILTHFSARYPKVMPVLNHRQTRKLVERRLASLTEGARQTETEQPNEGGKEAHGREGEEEEEEDDEGEDCIEARTIYAFDFLNVQLDLFPAYTPAFLSLVPLVEGLGDDSDPEKGPDGLNAGDGAGVDLTAAVVAEEGHCCARI